MKERPILFSASMVRALLDGSKTQTRRIAPIADLNIKANSNNLVTWGVSFTKPVKGVLGSYSGGKFTDLQARSIIASKFNPYGQPGDRLWVREAWTTHTCFDDIPPRDLTTRSLHYQADGQIKTGKNRPGMFMPRWASRITLEITAVRVERLLKISEADAKAEGAQLSEGPCTEPEFQSYTLGYLNLWNSINGPNSWDLNPWVWVIEFKKVTP